MWKMPKCSNILKHWYKAEHQLLTYAFLHIANNMSTNPDWLEGNDAEEENSNGKTIRHGPNGLD